MEAYSTTGVWFEGDFSFWWDSNKKHVFLALKGVIYTLKKSYF